MEWLVYHAQRTAVDSETGCWRWPGRNRDQGGYAKAEYGQENYAHRAVWLVLMGPIPEGHEVDHVAAWGCRYRDCWWIGHLQPVTARENTRRRDVDRTHCQRGHPFDVTNTHYLPDGRRQCRACRRQRENARNARRARSKEGTRT